MEFVPDRRSSPRARFSGITFVASNDLKFPCMAGDLSESGMLVFPQRDPSRVSPGHRLRLTFTLPEMSSWIELDGTLVRQTRHKQRSAWGIRFDGVPHEIRLRLRMFVSTCQSQSALTKPPSASNEIPPKPLAHRLIQSTADPVSLEKRLEQTRRALAVELARLAEAGAGTQVATQDLMLSLRKGCRGSSN